MKVCIHTVNYYYKEDRVFPVEHEQKVVEHQMLM